MFTNSRPRPRLPKYRLGLALSNTKLQSHESSMKFSSYFHVYPYEDLGSMNILGHYHMQNIESKCLSKTIRYASRGIMVIRSCRTPISSDSCSSIQMSLMRTGTLTVPTYS
ncbi:hypothetical protein WA026_010301 [Henosepilachna vigintioctopunctata]|uniref:Uncharacterized protein n=1 Tax=Henosepilachna vigintioctopunctata TaxID=420089 RepID=A0AAW1U9V6_9CUCU